MHHVRCVFGVCCDVAVSKYWYSSVCCLCFTTVMFVVLLSRLALMFLKELRWYLKCCVTPVCLTNSSVSLSPGLSNVSLLPPVSCSLQWISDEAGRLPKTKKWRSGNFLIHSSVHLKQFCGVDLTVRCIAWLNFILHFHEHMKHKKKRDLLSITKKK